MLIPIGAVNPKERVPWVNWTLLATNVAVFALYCFPEPSEEMLGRFALWPAEPHILTLFTSIFLHANLAHLIGNMLFLWIFGGNVEDKMGHILYLLFYLACGVAADFAHVGTTATPELPLLGASGAISGIVGAYVIFFPTAEIKVLFWWFFFARLFYIQAFWWIGFWFVEQVALSRLGFQGVAYAAHIGGFALGTAIALVWRFLFFPSRFRRRRW